MNDDDRAVIEYLSAIEARRAAPAEPDRVPEELASAPMVEPAGDSEGLRRDLASHTPGTEADIERLEPAFVRAARAYGERHSITYAGWVQAGVDPGVLARAGIGPDAG